jgi:hypothetical protein
VVRLRWNDERRARVPSAELRDLHVRSDPGGVCGAFPRGFLSARLWCDRFGAAGIGHVCRADTAPHELVVCILPADNPEVLMARLRSQARR